MKKIVITFICLLFSGIVAAQEKGMVTLFNTSPDGYMTISYRICHVGLNGYECEPSTTINIDSAKWGKHYQDIEIAVTPPNPALSYDMLYVDKVIEKEIIDGQHTDKKIAETRSESDVCDALGAVNGVPVRSNALELTDMNKSPIVVCKHSGTIKK